MILIKPDASPGRCGTGRLKYIHFLHCCRQVQMKDDRIVLLRAESFSTVSNDEDEDDSNDAYLIERLDESEWFDRVEGGDGCWNFDANDIDSS